MNKVIVVQTHFGKGYMAREGLDNRSAAFTKQIISKCQKSVKNWCVQQGYEYRLVTEIPNMSFKTINSRLAATELTYSYYQYECFPKQGYDFIIFLDNDIWIIDPTSKIPIGDWQCSTTHDPARNAFLQFKIDPLASFWNASILVMSQERSNHLSEWLKPRLEGKIKVPTWDEELREKYSYYNSHEMLLSWYCWHEAKPQHLPAEWHCRPKRFVDWERAKMIHFDGGSKEEQLNMLPKPLLTKFHKIT